MNLSFLSNNGEKRKKSLLHCSSLNVYIKYTSNILRKNNYLYRNRGIFYKYNIFYIGKRQQFFFFFVCVLLGMRG